MNDDRRGGQGGQGGQGGGGGQGGQGGQGHGGGGHNRGGRNRHRHHRGGQGGGGGQQFNRPPQHQGQRNNQAPSRIPSTVISDIERAYNAKTPIDPKEWIQLEKGSQEISMRAMDLLCPIGRGTRGLIVAPPKAGKTTFLKQISNAVHGFDPNIKQYCLLIDERPEEVTDFKRSVPAEVFASSSDQSYEKHIAVANDLIKLAVEQAATGADVFILLDSLTRLARVHNQFATGSRTMTGGLDSRAMEVPRRFFGAARKLEEGGSLTILATILVDTGSRMDEVIFQEFKGTGNMELVLSRQAADMRIFPAMKVRDSGTRKEEKLLPPATIEGVWKLRRALADKGDIDALKAVTEALRVHKTNHSLLSALK
ncbi:MAG: transcription termination factor Rho [Elusimicrobia bacterium]|nr:transcription termination factor Rho [Elusimicrobiota bacterium]